MSRFIAAFIMAALMASCAFAGIETTTLIDTTSERDNSVFIGATSEQLAEFVPEGKVPSRILAFLVKAGGREILFDAGLKDGHIAARLAENGVAPEKVSTILITHLHPDHFGGLVKPDGGASFPNAEVYIGKAERAYWVDDVKNENVISALKLYEGHVHLFDFGDEVLPGIKAIDTTGHTPGHTAFLVEDGGDKLLVVGDAIHYIEIQLPLPEVAVVYDVDPVKAVQSRKFILDYAAWRNIPVAGMHITEPGVISVKKSGEGYVKQ